MTRQRVVLEVGAPPDRVVDALRYQDAEIDAIGPQRTGATLRLDSWEWLLLNLAFLDADVLIDGPSEFTDAWRRFARRLLAATTRPVPRTS